MTSRAIRFILMVEIIGPAQYTAIRTAIRVDLDATDIPDEVIEQDIYAGEAERQLRVLDANVDTYVGVNFRRSQAAAVYLCAAILAPALPNITNESYGSDYRYTITGFDPLERSASLRWLAYEQIAANLGIEPLELIGMLPIFDVASAGLPGRERGTFPSLGVGGGGASGILGWW